MLNTIPIGAAIVHLDANGKTRINSVTTTNGVTATAWMNYDTHGKARIVKRLP